MDKLKTFGVGTILCLIFEGCCVATAPFQDASEKTRVTTSYQELIDQLGRLIALKQADVARYNAMLERNRALANTHPP